jgi:hypothetical protein
MKNILSISCLIGGLVLAGCATGHRNLTLDSVGPAPAQPSVASADGTLTVYSGFKVNADFNSTDPNHREYSNYKIFAADGKLLQLVQNDTGLAQGSPAPISLAPGNYRVVARANGYGIVTVPVVIQAGNLTIVHLEGGYVWPDKSEFNQTNTVRLPDGGIVGWRAAQ